MEIHIITAFPKIFQGPLSESIIDRAQKNDLVSFCLHDIRDFATDKHRQIDDYAYGGGAGMILKAEPIFRCVDHIYKQHGLNETKITLLSPIGKVFNQKKAVELSLRDKLILICGHYKGIDERIRQELVDEEISIGDYILTGGELPAMVIIDAAIRLIPGAISDIDSAETDSFQSELLDHPHYTRPEVFRNMKVPSVLLSGNHAKIEQWKRSAALQRTKERRLDLYNKYQQQEENLDFEEKKK